MRRFSRLFTAVLLLVLVLALQAFAYPDHVAPSGKVFDDGAVPQDLELIQSFRNSYLEDYPDGSYLNIGATFGDFFAPVRWWNYDEYNVVMAGLAFIDGAKSKVRISFYRESTEPVWISYAQVDGETVYRWDEKHNKLDITNLLREIYALH